MEMPNANLVGFDKTYLDLGQQKLGLEQAKNSKNEQKIKETAENFEAFFLTKTMESVFEGVSTDGMFGGGNAEKIYRSMLLDEYGKSMAKTGSVGVADYVMNSILEMQEMESQGYTSAHGK